MQSAGWSWGRLRKLNVYSRSASKTSKALSRCPTDSHTHIKANKCLFYWTSSECVVTSPHRYGVNHQMVLVRLTFSRAWEDSYRLRCLVIPASGQSVMKRQLTVHTAGRQSYKDPHACVFLPDIRRNVWPFLHFFPMTFLSSASVV